MLCVCKIRKEANKHSSVEGTGCDLRDRRRIWKAVKAAGDAACKVNGILIFPIWDAGYEQDKRSLFVMKK